MKKNKIYVYYILLGVGIGLALGSIINMMSPNIKVREYTDEEIVKRARELGMRSLDEIIEINKEFRNSSDNTQNHNSNNENNEEKPQVQNSNTPDPEHEKNTKEKTLQSRQKGKAYNYDSQNNEEIKKDIKDSKAIEYIEFEIREGDSSEKIIDNLFDAKIIDDKEQFTKAVVRRKAGRKIHYGKFKIPVEADYDTIIDILTK
ncbi:hypothetical protein [Paramaledivibacter caminithermalis]|jgi:hypothetical protein|uniref:YceG-like family protein n=1 Tax=Paramaledivibacter caminithermalis (strain DSM 15212 / CIP 107654 / DViRD3) TaxID=1121301 RepID=A0A1M6KA92_PARC5|nr:hypothetical protein [Paramaledivibacter caminithermalis]SHJ55846.1 hypothetical protein SAMN02745912_00345 [Paramaledivibacter caminithermalis DSM 15212]